MTHRVAVQTSFLALASVNNARIEISSAAGSILAGINLVSTEKDEVDISVDTARVRVAELDEVALVRLDGVRFSPQDS